MIILNWKVNDNLVTKSWCQLIDNNKNGTNNLVNSPRKSDNLVNDKIWLPTRCIGLFSLNFPYVGQVLYV